MMLRSAHVDVRELVVCRMIILWKLWYRKKNIQEFSDFLLRSQFSFQRISNFLIFFNFEMGVISMISNDVIIFHILLHE